jgi:RNase H-like domain found in reverse transcriptase
MSSALVPALPDFTKPFTLETDASVHGMSVVLLQEKRPIAYLSKALGVKNAQLSTYEKEYLALLIAIQKWRHYLQGMSFIIKTDHINLKHMPEQRLTHSLQHKGLSKMLGLDYIQYKRGSENRIANALSRRVHAEQKGQVIALTVVNPQWIED